MIDETLILAMKALFDKDTRRIEHAHKVMDDAKRARHVKE